MLPDILSELRRDAASMLELKKEQENTRYVQGKKPLVNADGEKSRRIHALNNHDRGVQPRFLSSRVHGRNHTAYQRASMLLVHRSACGPQSARQGKIRRRTGVCSM